MGHTQWMPEVWLNVGLDYDGDGRASPFGKPDDAGQARIDAFKSAYPQVQRDTNEGDFAVARRHIVDGVATTGRKG